MGYRICWALRMSRLHCGFFFLFPPSPFMCAIRPSYYGTQNENQSLKIILIGIHQDNNLVWRWVLFFYFLLRQYIELLPFEFDKDCCLFQLINAKKRLLGNALLLIPIPNYNFQRQRKTAMQIFVKTLTGKTITLEVREISQHTQGFWSHPHVMILHLDQAYITIRRRWSPPTQLRMWKRKSKTRREFLPTSRGWFSLESSLRMEGSDPPNYVFLHFLLFGWFWFFFSLKCLFYSEPSLTTTYRRRAPCILCWGNCNCSTLCHFFAKLAVCHTFRCHVLRLSSAISYM